MSQIFQNINGKISPLIYLDYLLAARQAQDLIFVLKSIFLPIILLGDRFNYDAFASEVRHIHVVYVLFLIVS